MFTTSDETKKNSKKKTVKHKVKSGSTHQTNRSNLSISDNLKKKYFEERFIISKREPQFVTSHCDRQEFDTLYEPDITENAIIQSVSEPYRNKEKVYNMQDGFINNCRHNKITVRIYFINKQIETGRITAFDSQTIILSNDTCNQYLIMKAAIAMIKPLIDVDFIFNQDHRSGNNNNGSSSPCSLGIIDGGPVKHYTPQDQHPGQPPTLRTDG